MPAEKLSPLPDITIQLASSFSFISSIIFGRPNQTSASRAFFLSGLFNQMYATSPLIYVINLSSI